jgi:hypothetical protein
MWYDSPASPSCSTRILLILSSSDLSIDHLVAIGRDNASVLTKAISTFKEQLNGRADHVVDARCLSHSLNLVGEHFVAYFPEMCSLLVSLRSYWLGGGKEKRKARAKKLIGFYPALNYAPVCLLSSSLHLFACCNV